MLEPVNGEYQIGSADDLRAFAKLVNDGETTANAILTDDINLNPGFTFKEDGSYSGPDGEEPHQWTPIGSDSRRYSGTFNGDGHTISGLYIKNTSSDTDYQGLFGYVSGSGEIDYLTVSGSVSVSGGMYVGGIAGRNLGNVINCTFSGSVSGKISVGGVVGYNGGTVENCYNTGSVSGNSVGGVVGYNSSTVENCYNIGEVSGSPVGGVVGHNDTGATVSNCYNIGTVTGSGDRSNVGGVVGDNYGSVTNCYFLKTETVNKDLQGIGNEGSGSGGAAAVNDLNALCKALESDTNTWTISPFCKHPVLQANPEGGLGTATHPYEIKTIDQLKTFRDIVNGANRQVKDSDAHAKLMNDIDLEGSETNRWTPIGNDAHQYTGTFNGDGHTIRGLYIDSTTANNQGLFGFVSGTVQNLSVSGTVNSSGDYVGGIVGYNFSGTVTNCAFSGSVKGSGIFVGGVVGNNGGTVTGCTFSGSGTVTGTGDYVGGIAGRNSGTVENCYNTDKVSGIGSVGGIVGYNVDFDGYSASVENCYNTGTVSDGTTSGGVVGYNSSSGNVTNCYFLQQNGVPAQGIGEGSGDATAKDNTAFHSGEVAYLLQGTQTTPVWGQSNLTEEDSWPTLIALDKNAKTVYQVTLKYDHAGAQDKTYYTDDTATPSEQPSRDGYTFDHWDKTEGEGNTITYTAKWTAEEPPYTGKYSYEVSTSVGDHGSLTVDRYATEGDKVTIDVTPDEAYKLDDLSVTANGKDVELTANGDGTYTFTMPSADVKITATFAEDPDWTEPEEPATDVSDLFIDIAPNAWYKDAVQYAYDNGLMTGVSATEFAPEQTTTRAMIVSILARLEGVTTAQAAGFADVDDNDWYATAVNWAANVGVVNGYEDNTFRPNTAITREQLAAILMNYAAYKGEDVSNRADLTSYTDQPSTWATETMSWAVAEGLISGVTNTELQPQGEATRAQVAVILERFLAQ